MSLRNIQDDTVLGSARIEIADASPNGRVVLHRSIRPSSPEIDVTRLLPATSQALLKLGASPRTAFDLEKDSFRALRDSSLGYETYKEKFVAIHKGKVVDFGEDKKTLAKRVYAKYGYVPIYIGKVERKRIIGEMSSPERV